MIRKAQVKQVYEFELGDMVIYLDPTDLLISKKTELIKRVSDPDAGNVHKEQIMMLPSFDPEFPFLAFSGHKTLNILNIETQKMQTLIDSPVVAYSGQQAFFFKKERTGHALYFVQQTTDDENKRFFNWYKVDLKDDFFENLKALGRLP